MKIEILVDYILSNVTKKQLDKMLTNIVLLEADEAQILKDAIQRKIDKAERQKEARDEKRKNRIEKYKEYIAKYEK